MPEKLLTVAEVAAELQMNPKTLYANIREGKLTAVHVGTRNLRIRESDLAKFVSEVQPRPKGKKEEK